MTDSTVIAILAAIPTTLTSLGALVIVWRQSNKIQEVKQIVDGPLSVALRNNAELSQRIAALTGDHVDAKVALDAAAVNKNQEEGKSTL